MSDLLAQIEEHFGHDRIRSIEVPEWGKRGAPLVIYFRPVTLDDQMLVHEVGNGKAHAMAAHMVTLKSQDQQGNRLFKQIDAVALRSRADPEVIARIYAAMTAGGSIESAEKN